jgi:exodeoxyribonuclease VII small subunit
MSIEAIDALQPRRELSMLRRKRGDQIMADTNVTDIAEMSFEQALAELETIVRQLESGEVELERSISIYERGAALRAHCDGKLKDAELKVEKIVQGADGSLSLEPAGLE